MRSIITSRRRCRASCSRCTSSNDLYPGMNSAACWCINASTSAVIFWLTFTCLPRHADGLALQLYSRVNGTHSRRENLRHPKVVEIWMFSQSIFVVPIPTRYFSDIYPCMYHPAQPFPPLQRQSQSHCYPNPIRLLG